MSVCNFTNLIETSDLIELGVDPVANQIPMSVDISNLCTTIYRNLIGAINHSQCRYTAKYLLIKLFVNHLTTIQLTELSAQIKADSLYGSSFINVVNTYHNISYGTEEMVHIIHQISH